MKLKHALIMVSLVFCLCFFTGCPTNNNTGNGNNGGNNGDTYPDVAGIWDWAVAFSQNDCDGGNGYNVILVITQDEGTGTWTSYDSLDTNLTCALETGTYTMDVNGNVTIDLVNYQFDPGGCNNDTPADAVVTIHITAVATSTQMTGTQTEHWSAASLGVTDCKKEGDVTAAKR